MSLHSLSSRPRVSLEELRSREVVEEVAVDDVEAASRPDLELVLAKRDIDDVGEEVALVDADVRELTTAADALDEIRVIVESSLEDRGMDSVSARIASVGAARALSRIGSAIDVPSMESYGTATSSMNSTRLTLEALSDKIKQIWEAIKEAVKKGIAALLKFFQTVTDRGVRIRDAAAKVLAAAKSNPGTPSAAKVTVKGAAAKLHINGQIPQDWAKQVAGIAGNAESIYKFIPNEINFIKSLTQSIGRMDLNNSESIVGSDAANEVLSFGKASGGLVASLGAGSKTVPGGRIPGVDSSNAEVAMSKVLPGNVFLYAIYPKQGAALPQAVSVTKLGLYSASNTQAPADEFTTLTSEQIIELTTAIVSAMDAASAASGDMKELSDSQTALLAAGDTLANRASQVGDSLGGSGQGAVQAIIRTLPALVKLASESTKHYTGYLMSIAPAAIDVAKASLSGKGNAAPALAAPAA